MALGAYSEALLLDEGFNALAQRFEQSTYQTFMSTGVADTATRERLFQELMGVKNFLSMMALLVQERQKLIEPAPSEEESEYFDPDAPIYE